MKCEKCQELINLAESMGFPTGSVKSWYCTCTHEHKWAREVWPDFVHLICFECGATKGYTKKEKKLKEYQ